MAFDLLTRKKTGRDWSCGGFSDDAKRAMAASPDYFVWWYSIKSVGLGVMAAGLAFMIGRATAPKKS